MDSSKFSRNGRELFKSINTVKNNLEKQIENSLYSHFGAFGIIISMSNGIITDGAIKIRDDCVKEIKELLTPLTKKRK